MDDLEIEIPQLRLNTTDLYLWEIALPPEDYKELISALNKTNNTGVICEVSPAVKVPFLMAANGVLRLRNAYIKKCQVNTENGSKGGKKKAENANAKRDAKAGETKEPHFTPPTKTELRKLAKDLQRNNQHLTFTGAALDEFYDELSSVGWAIEGVKIESQEIFTDAFYARFSFNTPMNLPPDSIWRFFKLMYKDLGEDYNAFTEAWDTFLHRYSKEENCWIIDGTKYDKPIAAVKAILAKASKR